MSDQGANRPIEEMATEELRRLVVRLRDEVDARHAIGMATGLLMARERVSSAVALEILTRVSEYEKVDIRDLAQDWIARHEQAAGEAPA